jgi:hypothetical protein
MTYGGDWWGKSNTLERSLVLNIFGAKKKVGGYLSGHVRQVPVQIPREGDRPPTYQYMLLRTKKWMGPTHPPPPSDSCIGRSRWGQGSYNPPLLYLHDLAFLSLYSILMLKILPRKSHSYSNATIELECNCEFE